MNFIKHEKCYVKSDAIFELPNNQSLIPLKNILLKLHPLQYCEIVVSIFLGHPVGKLYTEYHFQIGSYNCSQSLETLKFTVDNFHIGPDGKLHYTESHGDLKGTTEFCIDSTLPLDSDFYGDNGEYYGKEGRL